MTDNEISDIILDDLKTKSPRHLIANILAPRQLWDKTQEQRMKNIISLLTSKNLITTAGKYFPATDIQLNITGQGLDILNNFGSYSSFSKSQTTTNKGFSHNTIGDNFQGNTIIIGENIHSQTSSHIDNVVKSSTTQNIIAKTDNKTKKRSLLEILSWIVGIFAGLALLYEFVLKHWLDKQ